MYKIVDVDNGGYGDILLCRGISVLDVYITRLCIHVCTL